MIKKTFQFIFLSLAFLALPAEAYYNPGTPSGFVNDFAGVLSSEQKETLENKLSQFEKDTSNEITVVAIPSLQNDTIENFAVKLFEQWGIGKKNKDNGVLVLIALQDRKMRIEVGYGLEGALTDAQSSWIINQVMKPAFQQNNYYQGLDGAVDKIMAATKGEYVPSAKTSTASSSGKSGEGDYYFSLYLIFIFCLWVSSALARSKSWWAGGAVGGVIGIIITIFAGFLFVGLISIVLLIPLGLLFDFLVSRAYQKGKSSGHIPWWIGGGRGGFGGGSGGGFGGFGGGGSGGGGSSGNW